MDLGATICRPPRPACAACPARDWCVAATDDVPFRAAHARSGKGPALPFEQTSRWLRGRIVDQLRDAPAGTAVALDGGFGGHSVEAVAAALAGLARDGLVELDGAGHARLAVAAAP
jgi:A/G-specific adenine glycosylase